MADVRETLAEIDATLKNIEQVVNLPQMTKDIAALEEEAAAPNLWDNQENAQRVTSKLSYLQAERNRIVTLRRRVDDVPVPRQDGHAYRGKGRLRAVLSARWPAVEPSSSLRISPSLALSNSVSSSSFIAARAECAQRACVGDIDAGAQDEAA